MIFHWIKTGWRSLIANPMFSLITIASLSVGCCGALLAGANIKQHLSFDRWVPAGERTLLLRTRDFTGNAPNANADDAFVPGIFTIVGGLPEVEEQTVAAGPMMLNMPTAPDSVGPEFAGGMAYSNYFKFFGLEFVEGSADTVFNGPNQVVLSESAARQRLGDAPWTGKIVTLSQGTATTDIPPLTVAGVIRDMPAESHRKLDVIIHFDLERRPFASGMSAWSVDISGGEYVRLKPGIDVEAFQAKLKGLVDTEAAKFASVPQARMTFDSMPLSQIHLSGFERSGIESNGETTMLITLGSGAAALLIVSAFNFITLSMSRSVKRRREVALRKVLGANRGTVTRHYLAESFMVTVISLAIGFGLAELLHPWFARQLGQPDSLFDLYDPVFLGGAAIVGIILALLVGAYPALYLAYIRPRAGLELDASSGSGPLARLVSSGLLGLQIAAATSLLAIALTMSAQAYYVAGRPLGYSMENMFAVTPMCQMPGLQPGAMTTSGCDRPFVPTVRNTPGVIAATRGAISTVQSEDARAQPVTRPGQTEPLGRSHFFAGETDFLQMMSARLLAGRLFNSASPLDRQLLENRLALNTAEVALVPVVVTRAFLPLIGAATPEEAIGQRVAQAQIAPKIGAFEIVGVIEDWHRRSLRHQVEPIVFTPGGAQMQIVAKIDPATEVATRKAIDAYQGKPGMPLSVANRPLNDEFAAQQDDDRRVMMAVASFAALAIAIGGLGVFALSAFDIQRRVREIGIRKALGAAPLAIVGMIMGGSLSFAAIAAIISWPFGWWISNMWLNSFVYRTDLGPAVLPVAAVAIMLFVGMAVALNAMRAAAVRPSIALRSTG